MKKLNKILSVGLSLALCAGMVAPAFATNAYFYLEENGQYKFLGQGEMKENVENTNAMSNEDMKDAVTAPESEDGQQTLPGVVQDANHTTTTERPVTVDTSTIDAFFNGTEYEGCTYDNGTSDVLGAEHTYTVTWKVGNSLVSDGKGAADAAVKDGEVVFTGTEGAEKVDFDLGKDTVHFDGTVVKSTNTAVKVVVDNFNEEAVENGNLFVREGISGDELNAAVADAISSTVTELNNNKLNDNYYTIGETESKDGQFVKTYTEKTYTVTYQITGDQTSGVDVSDFGSTNGKATQEWSENMLKAVLSTKNTGAGSYTFSGWQVTTDENGNVIVTANCTFNPYYYDFGDITIDEPAVPLASGPVTRAEFIDYLWRHEGEPDSDGVCTFTDVAEDHDYVLALAWAEQNGIIEAYEDGTFEPDELITVGAAREFLGSFADVFGTNAVAASDLTSLTGEDDEAVLNCDEVLAEFFGEEYVAAEEDEAA